MLKRISLAMTVLAIVTLSAFAASADTVLASCHKDQKRIDIVQTQTTGLIAQFYIDGAAAEQADNVLTTNNADGSIDYATDMGVSLHVNGAVGKYSGIWPHPLSVGDIDMDCDTAIK